MKKTKNEKVTLYIDGKEVQANEGENLVEVAKEHGVYIPTLCYFKDMGQCLGTCRVCSVKVNGRVSAACTLGASENMQIEVNTTEMKEMRKTLIELMFVEGNHYCPSCEKSGDCHLQALAYKMEMTAPRFHYRFMNKSIDFSADSLILEHNRCILCKRCTNKFEDDEGHKVFSFKGKGSSLEVEMNLSRANALSNDLVDEVVGLCPVGAILKKGKGFDRPYGTRQFDKKPIGSEVDHNGE